jgi:hypothetical protein
MRLNLLDILKKQITEQGGKFKSMVDLQGNTAGDEYASVSIGDDMSVTDVLSKGEGTYDENTTYEEDALLGYHERAKKDRDEGITNPNLISDVIKALKIANISAEIHYSRDGHDKYTSTGNISRHWAGNAVDLSVIDGVGNKGGVGSNKGLCCPDSEKFMSGGDKIVAALETLGYGFGESGNVKGYLWRTDTGGNHWNHIHVSRTDRPEVKDDVPEKKEDKKITNRDDKKTITKSTYIIQLGDPSSKKFNIIWGGTPSSSYGASFMKLQGDSYLSDKNIIYSDWENGVSTLKEKLKKELGDGYSIRSVSGFSKGGEKTWDEINSGYDFVGLIDPSTSSARSTLPANVKMMSNHSNWSYYPNMMKALKKMEESGLSERVGDSKTYNHDNIPKKFFSKYSSNY